LNLTKPDIQKGIKRRRQAASKRIFKIKPDISDRIKRAHGSL